LPKTAKYSIGLKIDTLFVETIELIAIATFLKKLEKLAYIKKANAKVDTIKVFVQILWELKLLETKEYAEIGEKIHTTGQMIGGWCGQVEKELKEKQNSPTKTGEK